jgi:hypothetical protein
MCYHCNTGYSGQQIVLSSSQLRQPSALVVEEVLQRLLHVAVSDPNPTIRQTLLRALDQRFDRFLCQAHHLQTLFLLMGDEDFLIRLDAVTVSSSNDTLLKQQRWHCQYFNMCTGSSSNASQVHAIAVVCGIAAYLHTTCSAVILEL